MAATTNLDRSLAPFTETIGQKKRRRMNGVKYPVNYTRNKHRGSEVLKVVGLPYSMEYDFSPGHIECVESYSEFTTNWQGDIISQLTPFAIMEHCQIQMIRNKYVQYLNQN